MKKIFSIVMLLTMFFFYSPLYSYMTGKTGTISGLKKNAKRLTVKYVSNNKQKIFSYSTYYADSNTIVYKNGKENDFNALSRGDIVEVLARGDNASRITVLQSW